MPTMLPTLRYLLLAAFATILAAGELAAQQPADTRSRRTIVAVAYEVPVVARPDTTVAIVQGSARRSRSRGARRGLVVGLIGGALIGLVLTNDFLDEPAVNMMVSAGFFGLVGAGVGALIGAAPEPAPAGEERPAPPH